MAIHNNTLITLQSLCS